MANVLERQPRRCPKHAIILKACRPEDGAIEDCEIAEGTVAYFFESGAEGPVSRFTGETTITR